ncbi:MAG TPA: protease pro-enzyme activation domain-containing protein [Bryobacteraceae bacterium]|jgi:subtilase family serine protease|nr:protease pro-enzyme activation domain-containing protein [Bryobacteraceae bacterium]
MDAGRVEIPGSAPQHAENASRSPVSPGEPLTVSVILNHPDAADVSAVENFAHEYGLQVVEASAEKRTVKLAGTAAQMQAAFGVQLAHYGSAISYAGPITVPAALGGKIMAVLGLDQRPIARPRS